MKRLLGVRFEPASPSNAAQMAAVCRWANDPNLRHLIRRHSGPQSYKATLTIVDVQRAVTSAEARGQDVWLLWDPPSQSYAGLLGLLPLSTSARISVILDPAFQGRGLCRTCFCFAEDMALELGFGSSSVAVFSFHERAISVYLHLGYRMRGTGPGRTYFAGRVWPELILAKELP